MDKSAIKSFAIEARKILMKSAITQAGFYGVSKDGCDQPTQKGAGFEVYRTIAGTDNRIFGDDIKRREKLVRAVEEKGFDQVIEETAYTWFNRLIAIRFMEVNGYLPTRTRVLSSETGSNTPDLMSQYMDVDLDMTMDELEKVQTCVRENRYDDAFAMLFVKQCNALNDILPELFEKTTDYMELLLKLSYTSDGVVRMLVDTIPESDFDIEQEGQIEIIGWLYQFYNIEPKAAVFAKKGGKISKEEIPAATQLFTPDWIVRYMVENSLGRMWLDGHQDDELKKNWKYYLQEATQDNNVQMKLELIYDEFRSLQLENIKVIDPCMGSGHILVYCFDVLMQIYESQGYTQRDAVQCIIKNNIFGLDIDKRATQLSYFALMMKARQYDRRIFTRGIQPNVMVIENSVRLSKEVMNRLGDEKGIAERLIKDFEDAEEYGSILKINYDERDFVALENRLEKVDEMASFGNLVDMIESLELTSAIRPLIRQAKILNQKYNIVITNPPYMAVGSASKKLNEYVKKNYPDSKLDLFAVFIEKCNEFLKNNGYQAMITMHSWMSLGSYEKLRYKLRRVSIVNMAHLGAKAFEEISGEMVQTTSFVMQKCYIPQRKGLYCRLLEATNEVEKEKLFLSGEQRFTAKQESFERIPGSPISAYVADEALAEIYQKGNTIQELGEVRIGMGTGNNDLFLRLWWEIENQKIDFTITDPTQLDTTDKKYFPYSKGGERKRWYGNHEYVAWYDELGRSEMNQTSGHRENGGYDFYFHKGITWTYSTMAAFCARIMPSGFLFDVNGSSIFMPEEYYNYTLALLQSCVGRFIIDSTKSAFSIQAGTIRNIPIVGKSTEIIDNLVKQCIELSKDDWDSFETSWDFRIHPLLPEKRDSFENIYISDMYSNWEDKCLDRIQKLKNKEREIDQLFIEIYDLEKESSKLTDDNDITIHEANLNREIRSLISYAVGCMFGRYSIKEQGLIHSGGDWDDSKYVEFIPDVDNCIPITDEEYFEDDIVGLFCNWMKAVFGEKSLETNLEFIAKALGNKGTTSREVIRNYFLNDFMKDHMKIYQKRPIYWMFDSGKQNGFKCLTYMHRYDKDTVGRVRSDYLRKSQEAIEAALKNAEYTIQNSSSAIDKATATKKRDKYIKQLSEIRTYFQALSHVALQRIDIDLDDGVKVNYEKFQNIEIVDENGKKQKINLLTKI